MPRFDIKQLHCESHYFDRYCGRDLPEMDGYGWFSFERTPSLCTPKMAEVLARKIDLAALLLQLTEPTPAAIAA